MVKLATARECRMYGGSRRSRERGEYTNAGVYLFSTVVLLCGFVGQLSREAKSGLVVLLIGLGLMILVNLHDLLAHITGIDYRFRLMWLDRQLLFVELGVPALQALGALLFFIAILFILLQIEELVFIGWKVMLYVCLLRGLHYGSWVPCTIHAKFMSKQMGLFKSCNIVSTFPS